MTPESTWRPLRDALTRLRDEGRAARFWWRDDDAVTVTPALRRLVGLVGQFRVPVALAVIPEGAQPELADFLADHADVVPVVHGWAHTNHAPPDQKRRELWLDRPEKMVLEELARARGRIEALFPGRSRPILVPPWNRIDDRLLARLPGLGYRALSAYGPPRGPAPLPVVNATIDIIDSRGTGGCRPHHLLVRDIVTQLDAARVDENSPPVGLMTHHLVHDEAAWAFVEKLFAVTEAAGNAVWQDIETLAGIR